MSISQRQFIYLLWLAPFAFGALTFCTLTIYYWRQWREGGSGGGRVFGAFTALCGASFVLNLGAQSAPLRDWLSPVLDLATGMLPAVWFHLVSREQPRARLLCGGFYLLAACAACAMAGADTGLLPAVWSDTLESAPALEWGVAALLGLIVLAFTPAQSVAARRYRIWTRYLLALMLLASAATLLQFSPVARLVPDYLLLVFFCVTLYYKERLVFFDVVLKRGVFLAFSLLALGAISLARPSTRWGQWLMLAPLWLASPWIYGMLASMVDRVWLRRRFTTAEAERRFAAAVQAAENENDLSARSSAAFQEIFEAPAGVCFENVQLKPLCPGAIASPIGAHGAVTLAPRSNSLPYLSDDRNLLHSLARTLGVVLENVRFREREGRLRQLASRAELKALRAQINPHFLFNALNAIAGLIHSRPELAEETVEQLAEVFRYTLRKSESEWVRLDEELEFAAAYLRVEEARFGERLRVTMDIDPAATSIHVPSMSIQPLVENAVKHGTSNVEGQGNVILRVTLDEGGLWVDVYDNGPGFPAGFSIASPGDGHGLRNIAERLSGYYGDSAIVLCENLPEGTRVRLRIPPRAEGAQASK